VRFSIVTPSFRASEWLKLCLASVADQGVDSEHIVQDAGSDDGTLDWLPTDGRARVFVEKDRGMYDAVNRGFDRAAGELFAYLNCDEQYLPGTLRQVSEFFSSHPDIDVVFGDVIMAGVAGEYLFHRKMQTPLLYHTWTCHLSTLSCATFFRASLFREQGYRFDPAFRDGSDGRWMLRMLQDRVPMAALGFFGAVFTQTGANMSAGANAIRENRELRRSAPRWARWAAPAIVAHHRLRRWLGGMYSTAPFAYELHTRSSAGRRRRFEVARPRFQPPA